MQTLLLTKAEVEKALSMHEYIETVESAFKLYGQNRVQMPPKVYITFEKGDLRCMPAYIPDMRIAGVKNVNVHPGNRDMPTVMATITLIDPENGYPLAIMDGTHITKMRTGAAGAIAAKYLSREDSEKVAFVGAGAQAYTQLEGLGIVRPGLGSASVFDLDKAHAEALAKAASAAGLDWAAAGSVEEAVKNADIIVTTTPVRKPVVKSEWVKGGAHINAVGADAPGKEELDPALLKRARIVIDDWEQASHSGEINVPISQGLLTRGDIHATIGEVVVGKKPGRENAEQITVFDTTGLAIQDISSACAIYRKLGGKGRGIAFI